MQGPAHTHSCCSNLPLLHAWERLLAWPSSPAQVRRNRHVEILPLSTGCLGACTYCKTKHARGQLGSYALEALVARAREAAADPQVCCWRRMAGMAEAGPLLWATLPQLAAARTLHARPPAKKCSVTPLNTQVREIWLSSEDTGAYGRDIGTSLPQLLRALVEVLPPGGRAQ